MRRCLAVLAALAALAAGGAGWLVGGSAATQAAAAGSAPGWRLTRTDDFAGSALPAGWGSYGGPHGGEAASAYDPAQVSVSGGLLRLGIERKERLGRQFSTGGAGMFSVTQRYGRYEFRARAPLGAGIDSYATLWPADGGDADFTGIELLARPGAEKAYLSNNYGSGRSGTVVPGRYSDGFHVFAVEWAPGWFRVAIDGRTVHSDPHVSTVRKWIGFAVSSGDQLTGLPDAATRLPAEFLVDWVRMYAYTGPAAPPTRAAPPRSRTASPTVPPRTPARTTSPAPTPAEGPLLAPGLTYTSPAVSAGYAGPAGEDGGPPVFALTALVLGVAAAGGLVAAGYLRRRSPGTHRR